MKKYLFKKAFTFIELIIVISIMILITTSSVFYFLDFVKNKEVGQKIQILEDNLTKLDKDVSNYKIFDYEVIFDINTHSGGYISYINNFDINNSQYIDSFNSLTGSGVIKFLGSGTGSIKIYKKDKFIYKTGITSSDTINYDFNQEISYKIKSTLTGEILNDIGINYYSEDNLKPEKNNLLNLTDINTKKDKSGTNITKLIITNIGGKKVFYSGSLSNKITDDNIFLFFESNGVEKFIKITK
ncbi:hypothetical protein LRZ95_00925 [Candidatus Gracilibacteria bacterium]|nr:hypothetical protein [Candidatus Gracilibacteria bacterium]